MLARWIAVALALVPFAFTGCNAILGIESHPLATDGGSEQAGGGGGSAGGGGSSAGGGGGPAGGGGGACPPCALGTSSLGSCCLR